MPISTQMRSINWHQLKFESEKTGNEGCGTRHAEIHTLPDRTGKNEAFPLLQQRLFPCQGSPDMGFMAYNSTVG